jgi:hypothetical protein
MRSLRWRGLFLGEHATGLVKPIARTLTIAIGVLLVSMAAFGVVLLSPLLLHEIDRTTSADWSRLSEIGQTYGAASAILAMLALGGVAVSLLFQARQAQAQQVQAARQYHFELYRMTLDKPELYLSLWDVPDLPPTRQGQQLGFTNLIFNYYWMSYDLRAIPEPELRRALAGVFSGPIGQHYWSEARDSWLGLSGGRRSRKFVQIVEDEYKKSMAHKGSVNQKLVGDKPPPRRANSDGRQPIRMLVIFAGGVFLGAALRRKRQR